MSVSWYVCNSCGDMFNDCGSYILCLNCGEKWCGNECAINGNWQHKEGEPDHHGICKNCSNNEISDTDLLEYIITKTGVSREELIKQYEKDN